MNLHHDSQLFSQTLRAASQHLMINLGFVEKDYWITLLLRRLSGSKYSDEAVFKGGTSLSAINIECQCFAKLTHSFTHTLALTVCFF